MRRIFLYTVFLFGNSFFSFSLVYGETTTAAFKSAHGEFLGLFNPHPSNLTLEYLAEPGTEEKDGPGGYDLQIFQVRADVPFPLSRDLFLRPGLHYGSRMYDFDRPGTGLIAPESETLHKLVLSGTLGYFSRENLLLMGGLSVGAYSDLDESIEEKDIRVFGKGLAVYQQNPRFQLVGGFALSEDFEDVSIIPLLGFRWLSPGKNAHLSLTLPLEAKLAYRVSNRARVYLGGWIRGDQYHVRLGPANRELDLQVQDRRVGAGVVFGLSRNLRLQFEGGVSLKSQFKFQENNAGQFEGEVERGGYGLVRIGAAL